MLWEVWEDLENQDGMIIQVFFTGNMDYFFFLFLNGLRYAQYLEFFAFYPCLFRPRIRSQKRKLGHRCGEKGVQA